MRMVVVLPLPFGPRKPQIWPRSTWMLTWSTTVRGPKRLTRPRTSITGLIAGCTSTGWPGLSVTPAAGQASTMNTSLPRLPTL